MVLPELFANPTVPGVSSALTTLSGNGGSISSSATSFNIASAAPVALRASGQFRILIGSELMIVTAGASGLTWTVTRGAEGSTAASHTDGASIYHTVTAAALRSVSQVIDPRTADYGAKVDGTTDDTGAWTAAAADAQTTGIPLFVPPGTSITQPLTITSDINVVGSGWQSILKLKNAANGYVFTFSPTSGIKPRFQDFAIDGNAGNQTSGGCIYAAGSVQGRYLGLHLYNAYDVALWLYQIGVGNIGHHNRVLHCLFDNLSSVSGANQQGIRVQSNDENYIGFCDFENWGGLGSSPGSEPYAIKDWSGLSTIIANVFVGGQEAIRIQDSSSTRVISNMFDGQGRSGVHTSGSKNIVANNTFSNGSSSGAGSYAQCEIDNSTSADIIGNTFNVTTSAQVRNCVRELSSSSNKTNVVDNIIDLTGGTLFSSNTPIELHGTVSKAANNQGYNPLVALSVPAAPTVSNAATGGTVAAGIYKVTVTYVNAFGETTASAQTTTTTSGTTSTITITSPLQVGNAVGWYAYVSQAGGSTLTRQQAAGSPTAIGTDLTLTAAPSSGGAAAPGSNTTNGFATPGVPSSAIAYQNTFGTDCTVVVIGGTVTAIAVGGTITGLTSGTFRVPAGQTIMLTYSVAPSWTWIGE